MKKNKKVEKPIEVESSTIGEVDSESEIANDGNIEVHGKKQAAVLAMYLDKDTEKRVFIAFIKKVEKLVRSSPEYKDYVAFLREEQNMDRCAFLKNIDTEKAEIHLHHAISDLFSICCTVCNKLISDNKKVSSFILADYVLKLHFEDKIGLVPLSATIHELAHSAKNFKIPKSVIFGDWESYYEEYKDFMDPHEKNRYLEISELEFLEGKDFDKIEYKA